MQRTRSPVTSRRKNYYFIDACLVLIMPAGLANDVNLGLLILSIHFTKVFLVWKFLHEITVNRTNYKTRYHRTHLRKEKITVRDSED